MLIAIDTKLYVCPGIPVDVVGTASDGYWKQTQQTTPCYHKRVTSVKE